ncbi:MAG: hypothetical protein JWN13_891 [Betaproteobacteria bacterium]|jgi:hypothetical protein|nr:hypothetical protein [Betaproteobacteria bacterium]MEA3154943.1 hypothetical protein [Betaproteobacteria bacterium]
MKKLIALSVAAIFATSSLGAFATEVTRTDEVRADPGVKQEVRKGKRKVKRTARRAKHKTQAAASRAKHRTEAAADRARDGK